MNAFNSLTRFLSMILIVSSFVMTTQVVRSQTYCVPTVTNIANYGIGMQNVTMGSTINNTTPAQNGVDPVYNDYTNMSVSGLPGAVVNFSIRIGNGNTTNVRIFIDWDRDGTFQTSGSEVVYTSGSQSANVVVASSFTVPTGLTCGPCRIRVAGDLGSYTPAPCADNYGEYEDYTFMVLNSGGSTLDVAAVAVVSPAVFLPGNNNLSISYNAPGALTVNTVNIGYKLDNTTPVLYTNVSTGGLSGCYVQTKTYSFPSPVFLTPGSHILKIWVNNPNGTNPDNNIKNDTIIRSFCTTTTGTFTIDSAGTGNFKTFNEAVNSITCGGLTGPIKFNVLKGTYNERIVIPAIYGSSATNTITFEGANKANVILTYAGSSSTIRSTVVLNGADYITFKNMTIKNTGSSYANAIILTNQADYNQVLNCNLILTYNSGSNLRVIAACNNESGMSYGTNAANYNLFQGNYIYGGYYGAFMNGISSSTYCYGNKFINNDFNNQYYYNMYNYYESDMVIQGNYFHNVTSTSAYTIYHYYSTKTIIDANRMNPGYYGIYMYMENQYYSGNKSVISNNIINNFLNTSTQVGIYLYYYAYNTSILHNTIWVNGNAAVNYQYAAIRMYYYMQSPVIKNNILVSTGNTLLISGTYYPSGTHDLDYNDYYYPNSTGDKFCWYTNTSSGFQYYANLTMFKSTTANLTLTHDAHSFDMRDPSFISSSDLHISSMLMPMYGTYVGINTDIDGNPRCSMSPTVGADESTYPYPVPNTDFNYPDTIYTGGVTDFMSKVPSLFPYKFKWYINGTLRDTVANLAYVFNTAGSYRVALVAIGCGVKDSSSKSIVAIDPVKGPKAQFTVNINVAKIYDFVQLKDLSKYGPTSWNWRIIPDMYYNSTTGLWEPTYSFGTGSYNTSQNPVIYFLAPGTYTIALNVMNNYGIDSMNKVDYIIVKPELSMCMEYVGNQNYGVLYDDGGPTTDYTNNTNCRFLLTPCSPKLEINIKSFTLATGDYLRIYDGNDANGIKLYNVATYPNGFTGSIAPNTKFVSTTGKFYFEFVTDGSGTAKGFEIEWSADSVSLTPPVASFSVDDTLCVDRSYLFKNTSTGYGNKYYWDVNNDGFIDNFPYEESIYFSYPFPGSDTVRLMVENCGGKDTFIKVVTAALPNSAPKVGFYADNTVPNVGVDVITLIDTSIRCVDEWKWSFNPPYITYKNGTNKNSENPQVTFDSLKCYSVKLVATSNGYSDSLEKVCYIKVLKYCTPSVNTPMTDVGISNVTIGTINNTTDITSTTYNNYTSTYSTNLVRGGTTAVTVKRITSFNNVSIAVWIDLNIDGDFEDAGERVAFTSSNAGPTWTQNFVIPKTATLGPTRMRVGTNMANKPNLPCGVNKNGEFEDYKVVIIRDTDKPVITLLGSDPVSIEKGYGYMEAGATVFDPTEGDITSSLIITGTVDTMTVGSYSLKYNASDASGNKAIEITRSVAVTADVTPPAIILAGDTVIYEVNNYTAPVYSAIDNPFGTNLTSSVVITGTVDGTKLGTYYLDYSVKDANNNTANKTQVVKIVDTTPPIVTLIGLPTITLDVFSSYVEPGFNVSDNYWKNLEVHITGTVDTAVVGTYNLNYDCTDSSGNAAPTLTRTVIIQDTNKPVIQMYGTDTLIIEVHTAFVDPGANVTDNYCLPIHVATVTGTVDPDVLGKYDLYYDITDCEGNVAATKHRVVQVVDIRPPDISLIGHSYYEIFRWQPYTEDGYSLSDNYWSMDDITVDTLGDYQNTATPGIYYLQYKAKDGSGNVSMTEKRIIWVRDFTGINDPSAVNEFNVYPNPASGFVKISVNMPETQDMCITLFDMFGKELEKVYCGSVSAKTFEMNISKYSKGMYFVRLQSGEKQLLHKLIIQ